MEKTFIVANLGQTDSHGDIIMPGAMKFDNPVLLTRNFDHTKPPIGYAIVTQEEKKLIATADIKDEHIGLTPAIGFTIKKMQTVGSIRQLDEINLLEISLCSQPNADETIPPIN